MKYNKKSEKDQALYSLSSQNTEENSYNTNDNDVDPNAKNYLLCGIVCTKSLVIIFNVLFFIVGVLLVIFGVWTITSKHYYLNLITSSFYLGSTYLLIIAGCIIILNEVLGTVGAWFESKKILIVFIVVMALIVVIEIAAGILALAYTAQLKETLKFDLETLIMNEYGEPDFKDKTKLFDDLQINFKCCGASNFLDWSISKYVKLSESTSTSQVFNKVAESCCKTPDALCGNLIHASNINYKGCVPALEEYLKSHIVLLIGVSIISAFLQGIGIVLASFLIRRINQQSQYRNIESDDSKS